MEDAALRAWAAEVSEYLAGMHSWHMEVLYPALQAYCELEAFYYAGSGSGNRPERRFTEYDLRPVPPPPPPPPSTIKPLPASV